MIWILLSSFFIATVLTLAVIKLTRSAGNSWSDHDLSGPQKMHSHVVARIGGVGIFGGFLAGLFAQYWLHPNEWLSILLCVVCALPAFAFGLVEDITKSVSPRRRLAATMLSGLLGYYLLDASVHRTAVPPLDLLLTFPVVSVAVTLLVVAGVANSINIIDGMNGLASMCSVLMLIGLTYISNQVGDTLISGLSLAVGAVFGFFMWNYPRGLVFLGDGGAYFLGFMVAELGILLVQRNPSVSPIAPLLLVAYPVWETIFTMYRRRVLRGRPMTMPDGIHLHTLLYRRLMRWAVGSTDAVALTRGNSMTSPYLWVLCSLSVVPSVLWWDNTPVLFIALAVFVVFYIHVYWLIVRFRTPKWLLKFETDVNNNIQNRTK